MIASFRDKRARDSADGKHVTAFAGFSRQASQTLDQLEAAISLKDLASFPEAGLKQGDRSEQSCVRINDQRRICFEWPERSPGPVNV